MNGPLPAEQKFRENTVEVAILLSEPEIHNANVQKLKQCLFQQ